MGYMTVEGEWVSPGGFQPPMPGETKAQYEARTGTSAATLALLQPAVVPGGEIGALPTDVLPAVRPGRGVLPDMPLEQYPMIAEAPAGEPEGIPGISPVEVVSAVATGIELFQGMRSWVGEERAMGNGDVDLWGHAGMVEGGRYDVPVGGPGVPEPPAYMVARQWKTKAFSKTAGEYWVHFFRLIDGRIMCYNAARRSWKMWRPKKPIVLYRGKVTLSQAVRVQSMLDKMWKKVAKNTKALKMATASTRRK